jgi:hypothetical protein
VKATVVEVTVGVGVGIVVGKGFTIVIPLFQINFFPLFTHVYLLPLRVAVAPALEHFAPGVTAATDRCDEIIDNEKMATNPTQNLRISKGKAKTPLR